MQTAIVMKKKKIIKGVLAFLGMITSLQAQTIKVDFSHFPETQYNYVLYSGEKKDTIATGKLDKEGKATLIVPASKKDYVGMSQFILNDGGAIDFILNKENFSISCNEKQLSMNNVKYTGSVENDFISNKVKEQNAIVEKFSFVEYGLNLYKKEDALYPVFEKEKENIGLQFGAIKNKTANSPLYAAKFADIYDFLMGVGSTIDQKEEAKAVEMNSFITTKIDMKVLYNSGLWSPVIESWNQLQQNIIKDDNVYLKDIKQILSRVNNKTVYTSFAEKMVDLLAKTGKDAIVSDLGAYVAKSGKIENPGNNLINAMKKPVNGKNAPALIIGKAKKIIKSKTLLFFFEAGCNNCENEIHQLLGNYQILKDKGFEIISVAADMTPNSGDGHGHEFPWKDQLCDYKGFAGVNFKNYNVIGTPTYFIIDDKGIITGTYARLVDANILN